MEKQSSQYKKTAVLMVNLGSPASPTPKDVRVFLREFLSDTRVVELPKWLWFFILNGIVLLVRPKKSAKAYKKIWLEGKGSPLTYYSEQLAKRVQEAVSLIFEEPVNVKLAMRYGEPSIQSILSEWQEVGVERVLVLPLYPQYSATTTATVVDEVGRVLRAQRNQLEVRFIKDYYDETAYIQAMAQTIRMHWQEHGKGQKLLFSFHGLPKRCVEKGDPYQEQCKITAQRLASALDLDESAWQLSFQSRFGAETWLQPYTTDALDELAEQSINQLDVYCPGFAVDCLETLEEIAIEAKYDYLDSGGAGFEYIPALNDTDAHVRLMTELIAKHMGGWVEPQKDAHKGSFLQRLLGKTP